MRIRKIFIGAFLLTFFIGFVGFFLLQPNKKVSTPPEIEKEIPKDLSQLLIETTLEAEIIEENNDWRDGYNSKFSMKLLETGEGFHGDEIEAKSGENWLGLFEQDGKSYLEFTKLTIRRVHDPVIDGYHEKDATQKTGKSVRVNKKINPVFLLKNANLLKQGEITALYRYNDDSENLEGVDTSIRNGFVKEFKIGEVNYILRAKKGKNKKQEDILALVLESGNISQTLHSISYFGEGDYLGSLYWAGDLDRDGKPDFYFSLYIHDNAEYKNLFLSSQAKKGKLVKKVATFSITGC